MLTLSRQEFGSSLIYWKQNQSSESWRLMPVGTHPRVVVFWLQRSATDWLNGALGAIDQRTFTHPGRNPSYQFSRSSLIAFVYAWLGVCKTASKASGQA